MVSEIQVGRHVFEIAAEVLECVPLVFARRRLQIELINSETSNPLDGSIRSILCAAGSASRNSFDEDDSALVKRLARLLLFLHRTARRSHEISVGGRFLP